MFFLPTNSTKYLLNIKKNNKTLKDTKEKMFLLLREITKKIVTADLEIYQLTAQRKVHKKAILHLKEKEINREKVKDKNFLALLQKLLRKKAL